MFSLEVRGFVEGEAAPLKMREIGRILGQKLFANRVRVHLSSRAASQATAAS